MKHTFKALLLTVVCIILLFNAKTIHNKAVTFIEKELYPFPDEYKGTVLQYSEEYNIPPEIICAVINTESSFEPDARSSAGAMGMMQITEDTFEWLQFKSGEEQPLEALYDYGINIRFGCYLLRLLYDEFGDWDTAFAAYNAGRTRVNGWLENEKYSENGKLKNIPIKETDNYIRKVNRASGIYKKHYFTEASAE